MNLSNALLTQYRHIEHIHEVVWCKNNIVLQNDSYEKLGNFSNISFDIFKELSGMIFSVYFIFLPNYRLPTKRSFARSADLNHHSPKLRFFSHRPLLCLALVSTDPYCGYLISIFLSTLFFSFVTSFFSSNFIYCFYITYINSLEKLHMGSV